MGSAHQASKLLEILKTLMEFNIPKTPFRTLDADDVEHSNSTTYFNRDNIVPNVEFVMYQHVNFGHVHAIDRSIVYMVPFRLALIPQSDLK